jgi:co-chaperonin GroES (HSP10)
MNLKAREDCLIVRPDLEKSAMIALLRQKRTGMGIVVKIGPDATEAKVGDRVVFGDNIGQDFKWEGEDLLVMREKHVLGVVDE